MSVSSRRRRGLHQMDDLLNLLISLPRNAWAAGMQMLNGFAGGNAGINVQRPAAPAQTASRVSAPPSGPAPQRSMQVNRGRLNTSRFVVLGEGLAAGMGDFSLSDVTQQYSFPAQIAQQIGADFPQSLIQPPGIGDVPGFAPWPVIVPSALQSTVLDQIPPDPPSNLSVPGFTVADALRMRPHEPIIDRASSKQTV